MLRHSEQSLQESMLDNTRSSPSLRPSPRSDPSLGHEAGVPCSKTAALMNHLHSPRGPLRVSPCNMDEFCNSPRRQLQRGFSCPPARTDPITHAFSVSTDPLATRALGFGHLTSRDRTLRKCGYTAQSAIGKLDLRTHAVTSCELHDQARAPVSSFGLSSASLTGEEQILRCVRPVASDIAVSARYQKLNNRRDLTFIDICHLGGRKGVNPSLRSSPDLYECMGQSGHLGRGNAAGSSLNPPSEQLYRSPPASEASSQRASALPSSPAAAPPTVPLAEPAAELTVAPVATPTSVPAAAPLMTLPAATSAAPPAAPLATALVEPPGASPVVPATLATPRPRGYIDLAPAAATMEGDHRRPSSSSALSEASSRARFVLVSELERP